MIPALLAMVMNSAITAFTVADMNRGSRILLIAGRSNDDPDLARQRRSLSAWRKGAADRDLLIVEVDERHAMQWFAGNERGATGNDVAVRRRRYGLAAGNFHLVLIGKDGHVALRSSKPLNAAQLQGTIDAMPMRRAGQR